MEKNYSVDDMLDVIGKAISITDMTIAILKKVSNDLKSDIRNLEREIKDNHSSTLEENNV